MAMPPSKPIVSTVRGARGVRGADEEIARLQAALGSERAAREDAERRLAERDQRLDLVQRRLAEATDQADGMNPPASRAAIIVGLAKLAESRDGDTGGHLARIRHYTATIAGSVTDAESASVIAATSVLHDIGKVGVPDDILLFRGTYNEEQFEQMKCHTTIGADILLELSEQLGRDRWIDTAIQITLGHHERWNGAGYPFGLAGETISLPGRIVAVADVYDALRSVRVYKPAMSHEQAVATVVKGRGSHFDPEIVDVFVSQQDEIEDLSVRLTDQSASPDRRRPAAST